MKPSISFQLCGTYEVDKIKSIHFECLGASNGMTVHIKMENEEHDRIEYLDDIQIRNMMLILNLARGD